MKKRLADLACRRRVLIEKIETQRVEVAGISQRWQKPLALVDAGVKAIRFIHSHPALVAGGKHQRAFCRAPGGAKYRG